MPTSDAVGIPPLTRYAGPVAIAAGTLFTLGQLVTLLVTNGSQPAELLAGPTYRAVAVVLLLAFAGLALAAVALYERHAVRLGRLGAVALGCTLLGTFLLVGDYWFETFAVPWYAVVLPDILSIRGAGWLSVGGVASYVAFSVGWLLFAAALFRARVAPRPACVALAVGAVLGYAAALPPYGAPLGLAVGWLGVVTARRPPVDGSPQDEPAPPGRRPRRAEQALHRRRGTAVLTVAALLALPACAADLPRANREVSYQVDQPVRALQVDARAASVVLQVGEGPVTVTEEYRYSADPPTTTHAVQGQVLRLTESGCGDDDARCAVRFRIRVPARTSAEITAQAGAVELDGLAGDVHVTTQAGAVEGHGLTSDEVTVATEAGAASLEFRAAPTLVRTTTTVGAVELRVPRGTAYAVAVSASVGGARVDVVKDAASTHRIEVRTEVGGVAIESAT